MSEEKFTPAPWCWCVRRAFVGKTTAPGAADANELAAFSTEAAEKMNAQEPSEVPPDDLRDVPESTDAVLEIGPGSDPSFIISPANARLIQRAPDLYEALSRVLEENTDEARAAAREVLMRVDRDLGDED